MAINYIDAITIDGKGNGPNRKLFNGYIYRLNYDISMGDSKSTITANIVSEDGEYSINPNDLNYSRVYPIKIGNNISVNMFLQKYRKIVDPESKLVELTFCDTSVKMDRFFVGLYKRHGLKSKDNVIIVGREIHPCDKDFDDQIDAINELEDECHPCRNTATKAAELQRINCKDLNKYTIFPVSYNFGELVAELKKFYKINVPANPNPNYRQTYTGTVREVLSSWCADFGWIFYWEDETIKFIDLRRTIEVNAKLNDFCPFLSAYEEEYSLEGTVDNILATYYERPGSNDEFQCYDALHFRLQPFSAKLAVPGELQIAKSIEETAAGLIQYSEVLRDLWYYYDKYGLRDAGKYKVGKFMPKVGLTILSSPIMLNGSVDASGLDSSSSLGSTHIEPSTGLSAPKGFPINPEPSSSLEFLASAPPTAALAQVQAFIQSNEAYKMCFELLNAEEQWVVANGLAKNPEDYFFFVGFHDETLESMYKQEEHSFGKEFLGRYYIHQPNLNDEIERKFFEDYTFIEDKICNLKVRSNDDKISYNILNGGGGDSIQFFNNPGTDRNGDLETLSALPFAEWLHIFRESRQAAQAPDRGRMFKLLVVKKNGELFYPSTEVQYSEEEVEEGLVSDAIKNPKLIRAAQKHAPIRLSQKNNARGEFIPRKVTELLGKPIDKNLDRTKVFIFLGRAVGKDDFRIVKGNSVNISNAVGYPFDGKPIMTDYEDEFDIKGEVIYKYPDIKCKPLGNETNLCFRINFKTPEAIFSYYEPTYSNYGVAIEKEKIVNRHPEKLQTHQLNKTKISNRVGEVRVISKDITDDDITIFQNKNNSCRYNLAKIKEFHDKFAANLEFTYDKPVVSKTFTVEGVDIAKTPKIGDGLVAVQIAMDEEGIKSTYTLGTRLMQPINEDVLRAKEIANNTAKSLYSFVAPFRNSSNQG